MNYFLNDLYKDLQKSKNVKDYIANSKDKYLSEELWKIELENANKKVDNISKQIEQYK